MKDMMPPQNPSRVRNSFARGLASYHDNAQAQARIAETLATTLHQISGQTRFDTALEFGCGTGHLTSQLRQRFDIGHLTLNDLVPDCADHVHLGDAFIPGSIQDIPLPTSLDLITSASTVQWIEDLPALMQRLNHHLRPGGWLALSSFGPEQYLELQRLGSASSAPSYVTPDDWAAMLPPTLELRHMSESRDILRFASARDVLRHLRVTGVNGNAQGGWTRARLAAFEQDYATLFGDKEGVSLTYAPVWLIARKRG